MSTERPEVETEHEATCDQCGHVGKVKFKIGGELERFLTDLVDRHNALQEEMRGAAAVIGGHVAEKLELADARDAAAARLTTLVGDLRAVFSADLPSYAMLDQILILVRAAEAESSGPAIPDGTKGAGR